MKDRNASILACVLLALAAQPLAAADVPNKDGGCDQDVLDHGRLVSGRCLCGSGTPDHIVGGGYGDDFHAGLQAAIARPELLALAGWRRSDFGDFSANQSFSLTLRLPPGKIVRAELEIRMQPTAFPASNDLLYLGIDPDKRFTYFWQIAHLPEARGHWEVGQEPTDFRLDLGALPGDSDLLPKMNAERLLDVRVQDDTMVDYVELALWTCPRPEANGGDVIAGDLVRDGRSLLLDPQRDVVGRTERKLRPAP